MNTKASRSTLRVALVTQGYQSAGGVQTVARWLNSQLTAAGHTVAVFDMAASILDETSRRILSPRSWRRASLITPDSAERDVFHVGANAVELEPLRYMPRRELTRALDTYDVIQVVAGGPALAFSAVRSHSPIVLQVATTVAWERESSRQNSSRLTDKWRSLMSRLTTRLETAALKRTTAVLVENRTMEQYVLAAGAPHVELAPPGIDTTRFSPGTNGWTQNGYLLSLCRLNDRRKRLDRLIRAYSLLVDHHPSAPRLILAGRASLPPNLRELIGDLNLVDRVSVLSSVPDCQLPALYQQASAYLQTSSEEGLGISVLEAMACGVPVISTSTAGTNETILNGVTGWLLPQGPEMERDLVRRALSVLTADGAKMSTNARQRAVREYSQQSAFARFAMTYGQVCGVTTSGTACRIDGC